MATIQIQMRSGADKSGLSRLRVCIQDRGDRRYLPLQIKLRKADWDSGAQRVKSSHPKAGVINNVLRLKLADLQSSVAKESLNDTFSLDTVAGRKVEKHRFHKFAGDCLDSWERSKSSNSIRAYTSMLRQVKKFDPDISVEDIGPDWLARYEDHCRKECGDGGTLKRIAFVSVIIKEAIRKKLIERDPFVIYKKPPKKNPPKIWLTTPELKSVEKLAASTKSDIIKNTSYWFLLSCYTGLRYGDIEKFDKEKAVQEGRLILYTQKTGEVVSIKLTPKIKELIRITSKLPKVYSNQKINQYLKGVAHLCKINKLLTFHSGRHTFGMQCANRGISQEVTAKLMGHSDLKTTGIYYKIINTRIDAEMKKWE
jgi:integrase/recombinase XerD